MPKFAIGLLVAAVVAVLGFAPAPLPRKDRRGDKDRSEEQETLAARLEILANAGPRPALNDLMKAYKLKEKGGLGFGGTPDPRSGLEAKIITMQRTQRGPTKETLKKEGKDLIKLAHVSLAMAELARPHFVKPMGGKGKKDWDRWLDDQKKAARELIDAVKKEDGKAASKAARDLLASCIECHATFRR